MASSYTVPVTAYGAGRHGVHNIAPMRSQLILSLILLAAAPLACEAQSTATLRLLQNAMTLTPDTGNGEHLYNQYCSACHQPSAWGNGPHKIPSLAGQQSLYLLEQLIQFSVRDRTQAAMHRVVTQPEITSAQAQRDISAYVAALPLNPNPDSGAGTQLHVGKRLYTQTCAICHGNDGAGSAEDLIPAIGGQRYGYLTVRLREFPREHTDLLEPALADVLRGLSPSELQAVAAYTSSLPALRAR
ncbi:MAG TPA: c-type cytochrome [Steroidobacteraceae bacterium]